MIEVGRQALHAARQDGEDVSLSHFRGRPVVLYFYPEADPPGA